MAASRTRRGEVVLAIVIDCPGRKGFKVRVRMDEAAQRAEV
jgi:hypothetical protein